MAYESVLGLFVDNEFGASPTDIAILVTSTGIVSTIIQLFAVDRVVRRFGEPAVLTIFLGVVAGRIFIINICFYLCNVFCSYVNNLSFHLNVATCIDDTYFQVSG